MAKSFFKSAGQFLLNQGVDLLSENSGKIMNFVMNKAGDILFDAQDIARNIGIDEKTSEKALGYVLNGIDQFVRKGPDALEEKFVKHSINLAEKIMKEPKNQLLSDRSTMSRYNEPDYIEKAQRLYTDSLVPRRRVESLYAQQVPKVNVPKITKPQVQPRYSEIIKNQPEYIQSSGGNASFGDPRSELSDGNNPQVSRGRPAKSSSQASGTGSQAKPLPKPPVKKRAPVKRKPLPKPKKKVPAKSSSRASGTGSQAKPAKKAPKPLPKQPAKKPAKKSPPSPPKKPKKMVNVL